MAEREEKTVAAAAAPLDITTSFEYTQYDDVKQVTAMVELKTIDVYRLLQNPQSAAAAAHDIVLVLDVSSSMNEDNKLRMMIKTAEYLIRNLPIGNSLAVVTFSEVVNTIIPLTQIPKQDTLEKRQDLTNIIRRVKADGNTNLCGALLEGLDILTNSKAPTHTQQMMILLTDGVATAGVKDAATIQSLMNQKWAAHTKIRQGAVPLLHTIGVGETHNLNRKLLENIASTGNGTFFLVQTTDRIASCLGDCMASLLSMVAANITLTLTIPSGVELVSCGGLAPKETSPSKLVWSFQDLLLGESRNLLIGGRNITPGQPFIEHFDIDYLDVILGQPRSIKLPGVLVPRGGAVGKLNPEVHVHMLRVMVATAMTDKKIESLKMYKTLLQTADENVAQHPISVQLLLDIEAALKAKSDVSLRAQSLVRQRTCQYLEDDDNDSLNPFTSQSRRNYQMQYTQGCEFDVEEPLILTQLPPSPADLSQ